MTRVLLTGATGFIGRHTAPALVARDYEVHAVTSRRPPVSAGVTWHQVDLVDTSAQRVLLREVRPTHLLHLAWSVEPGAFWTSPANLEWVGASLNLLRAFVEFGGTRVVVAGTCAEYEWTGGRLSEDVTPIAPATLYGVSKDALHRVARRFAQQNSIELAWARLFFLFGPFEPPSRLVSSIIRSLLRGERALCASGSAARDYLHVADTGDALAAILASRVQGPVNVGSGTAVRIRTLVEQLAAACEHPELLTLGAIPDRVDEPACIVADVERLRTEVSWSHKMTLEEGLASAVGWWRAQLRTEAPA